MMRRLVPAALLLWIAFPVTAQEDELTFEICSACHDEAEEFAAGPHGRAMARREPAILERSCYGCHRPTEEHIDDPTPDNVVRQLGDESCSSAGCHPGSGGQLHLAMPAHSRHDVGCLDCHDASHQDPDTEWLLKKPSFDLCGGCHATQAAASKRPFAHRDGVEPFACVSCHSAHGTRRVGRLALGGNGGACLDCHTEKSGPFVFPHPPREVDGCVACHEPHGSTNPRLLTRRLELSLCLECHANVPSFHDITQARFRACVSCHFAVHGSNRDPRLLDE